MKLMKSCRDITRLVSEGLDRELGFGERIAVRMHFVICRGCENVETQVNFLRDALRGLSSADRDPPR